MDEPLFTFGTTEMCGTPGWRPTGTRSLGGLRIHALTRLLAGPIATRFLAGFGTNVLRLIRRIEFMLVSSRK